MAGQEHLPFAQVAPEPLRGQVHVHTVRRVVAKVQRIVVVDVLGTADLQTVVLQANPKVGPHRRAFVTLRLLIVRDWMSE